MRSSRSMSANMQVESPVGGASAWTVKFPATLLWTPTSDCCLRNHSSRKRPTVQFEEHAKRCCKSGFQTLGTAKNMPLTAPRTSSLVHCWPATVQSEESKSHENQTMPCRRARICAQSTRRWFPVYIREMAVRVALRESALTNSVAAVQSLLGRFRVSPPSESCPLPPTSWMPTRLASSAKMLAREVNPSLGPTTIAARLRPSIQMVSQIGLAVNPTCVMVRK
mmetsp:Transcript_84096/g.262646  ORF Transcript_84096/g.262646 Transcript_84096/m.262646 type:complete len:223 (-) Transcript_84096:41-709(-)